MEVGYEQHFLTPLPVDPVASTGEFREANFCHWLAMGSPADAQITISAKSGPKASLP